MEPRADPGLFVVPNERHLSNPPGGTRRFLRAGALPRTHFI